MNNYRLIYCDTDSMKYYGDDGIIYCDYELFILRLMYYKERFADTPMNDEELEYCTNDVIGLVEALHVARCGGFTMNNYRRIYNE